MDFLVELIVSEYTAKAIQGDFGRIVSNFQHELSTKNVELAVIVSENITANPIIKVTCFTTRTGEYVEAVKTAWSKATVILREKVLALEIWDKPNIWFVVGSPE